MKAGTKIFPETIKQFLFLNQAQIQYLRDKYAFILLQPARFNINFFSIPAEEHFRCSDEKRSQKNTDQGRGCHIFT